MMWDIVDYTESRCVGDKIYFGKMDIRASCPICGHEEKLQREGVNLSAACPECGESLSVPIGTIGNAFMLCEHDKIEHISRFGKDRFVYL